MPKKNKQYLGNSEGVNHQVCDKSRERDFSFLFSFSEKKKFPLVLT